MRKLNQYKAQQYFQKHYYSILDEPVLDLKYNKFDESIEMASIQGWRSANEDRILVSENNGNILAVVFDGHGGDWVANYCAEFYDKILFNTIEYKKGNYYDAFKKANKIMDQQLFGESYDVILNYARSNITKKLLMYRRHINKMTNKHFHHSNHCGCTCCAVLITPSEIICSNIGDSKAIALSEENLLDLNYEHNTKLNSEEERLTRNGFPIIEGRIGGMINVTRGFGDFEFKDMQNLDIEEKQAVLNMPEILTFSKDLFDKVIIGCDGLWDCYSIHKCKECVDNGYSIKDLAKSCINPQHFYSSGQLYGYDNVSIIIINLE